ncbi:peptide-methionine (S)-S-oxide reductase [Shewanella sp. NR704-98]|uniref:peptide-methionine (S)-S-oxide reductase n=2 Tax=Shewanella nanhaiensis TaxID=2864872 RepID=A0ABS7E1M1_9GAMM|nr:peptide-methionine (S)-S-oxide reductase [Shewanella nanhaiensis]MBW8183061.1 peptide-methionine (S)-S-oxide reductase [Shewanella nanhaiensis]
MGSEKLGLSGTCYWCTEAIFQSLNGVEAVEQGWISSIGEDDWFSEGIIVTFNPELISLKNLIDVHLHTHSSTRNHSMRDRYRSGVYAIEPKQLPEIADALMVLQSEFTEKLITQAYAFNLFKPSADEMQNYYYKDTERPFCQNIITPKLQKLLDTHGELLNKDKLNL